jgi:uncharacterized membrane protein
VRLHCEVTLRRADAEAQPGRTVTIGFALRNDGGRPARNAGLWLESPDEEVETVGVGHRTIDVLEPGAALTGEFRVRASRPGEYVVELRGGASNANHPAAAIAVPVVDQGSG